jgi:hypothetical protein
VNFSVLRNYLTEFHENWISPSELSRVNFVYFGIIPAEFHKNCISPSELSRVNFLYFGIISTRGICLHLQNYLGNHPQDAIFALWIHRSKSESAHVVERVPPLRPTNEVYGSAYDATNFGQDRGELTKPIQGSPGMAY